MFQRYKKEEKKSRGNQRKIKINSPCSCLYVCSLSLSLSPMSAPARTRTYTYWLLLFVWFYCYTALLPRDTKDHLRSGGILSSFVILLFITFSLLLQILCIHILLSRGETSAPTRSLLNRVWENFNWAFPYCHDRTKMPVAPAGTWISSPGAAAAKTNVGGSA